MRTVKSAQRDEFEAIAPRIFCVEAARAGNIRVISDLDPVRHERLPQFFQICNSERRMRFSRGCESLFDADMNLLIIAAKPTSAARAE